MRHLLKALLLTVLTATFFTPAVFAYDKVDRSKLTHEQTLKQISKDLAELKRTVEAATKDLADEKIVCPDPVLQGNAREEQFFAEAEKVQQNGYVLWGFVAKEEKQSYWGTGLRLHHIDVLGIVKAVVGTVPGSPAAKTEFFDQPYVIYAVDGKEVFWKDMDEVHKMILGDGRTKGGVVLTLQREDGGRDFVRYIERNHITISRTVMCARYRK